MSADDPEEIRAEIERTRGELSRDVDALRDKVSPGQVARRQADRVRAGVARVKDRVRHPEDGTAQDDAAQDDAAQDDAVEEEAIADEAGRDEMALEEMARDENAWPTDRGADRLLG